RDSGPAGGSMSMTSKPCPVGTPMLASGVAVHQARTCARLVVASLKPRLPGKGFLSRGWRRKTAMPLAAYHSAAPFRAPGRVSRASRVASWASTSARNASIFSRSPSARTAFQRASSSLSLGSGAIGFPPVDETVDNRQAGPEESPGLLRPGHALEGRVLLAGQVVPGGLLVGLGRVGQQPRRALAGLGDPATEASQHHPAGADLGAQLALQRLLEDPDSGVLLTGAVAVQDGDGGGHGVRRPVRRRDVGLVTGRRDEE